MLDRHPEVAALIGRTPSTAPLLAAVVLAQLGAAAVAGHVGASHWWVAIVAAYCFGAFAAHAIFVIVHECCHNSVFAEPKWNKALGILADLANSVPTAISFRCYHVKHHSHLGDYAFDADMPSRWEADLFGGTPIGKAAWLFLFPVLQVARLGRLVGTVPARSRWMVANVVVVVLADIAIAVAFGPCALLYLFASLYFSIGGLHVLGARLVQEHFTLDGRQETADYHGPLNLVALNAGYHNEHHDFPDVPWSRLPRLKAIAPEFYDGLPAFRSWSALLVRFVCDRRYSLYSRVERTSECAGGI